MKKDSQMADWEIEARQIHVSWSYQKSERMASEQNMTQAIMQEAKEATKAAIMIAIGAETLLSSARTIQTTLGMDGSTLKQPMLEWEVPDRYLELCSSEIEAKPFT